MLLGSLGAFLLGFLLTDEVIISADEDIIRTVQDF